SGATTATTTTSNS
nr:Chain C, SER-GLY-ALA-THR-THR-ALA-THR-THR-THR-THR-SER-ASN-SER [Porphyromonas gingivalis W83]